MRNRFTGLQRAAACTLFTLAAHQSVAALPSHPIVQTFGPTPEDIATGTSTEFGFASAIQNDVALIGVFGLGKVDIYRRSGASWTRTGSITPPEATTSFGRSIVLQGDTAVITADGSAYVFRLIGGTWRYTAKLTAPPGEAAFFPQQVKYRNNVVVIGNPLLNTGGVVYVYQLNAAGRLVRRSSVRPQDTQAGDRFGIDVALSDCTLVVGAPGSNGGAAYVFKRSPAGWSQVQRLNVADSVGEGFGSAVAINAQGVIAVGSPQEDPQNVDLSTSDPTAAGATFVFVKRTFGAYAEVERLRPTSADVANFVGFGENVLVVNDKLVVAAHELFQGPGDFATHYAFTYTLAQGRATPFAFTPFTPPPTSTSLSSRWLLVGQAFEPGCGPNICTGRALLFDVNQVQ